MIVIKSFVVTVMQILRDYALFSFIITIIFLYLRDRNGKKNSIWYFFFYMYSVLICAATILERITEERVITDDFLGIRQLFENPWYIVSFLENIVMFIPFGILYVLAVRDTQSQKQCFSWAAMVSISIEVLQGVFHLGEAQVIDVCANIFGALAGWKIICTYHMFKERKRSSRV